MPPKLTVNKQIAKMTAAQREEMMAALEQARKDEERAAAEEAAEALEEEAMEVEHDPSYQGSDSQMPPPSQRSKRARRNTNSDEVEEVALSLTQGSRGSTSGAPTQRAYVEITTSPHYYQHSSSVPDDDRAPENSFRCDLCEGASEKCRWGTSTRCAGCEKRRKKCMVGGEELRDYLARFPGLDQSREVVARSPVGSGRATRNTAGRSSASGGASSRGGSSAPSRGTSFQFASLPTSVPSTPSESQSGGTRPQLPMFASRDSALSGGSGGGQIARREGGSGTVWVPPTGASGTTIGPYVASVSNRVDRIAVLMEQQAQRDQERLEIDRKMLHARNTSLEERRLLRKSQEDLARHMKESNVAIDRLTEELMRSRIVDPRVADDEVRRMRKEVEDAKKGKGRGRER